MNLKTKQKTCKKFGGKASCFGAQPLGKALSLPGPLGQVVGSILEAEDTCVLPSCHGGLQSGKYQAPG